MHECILPTMNFISNLLLGTPPSADPEKHVERPKVSDEEEEEDRLLGGAASRPPPTTPQDASNQNNHDENTAEAKLKNPSAQLPATTTRRLLPIPRASFVRGTNTRARSLSRVYNQVPRGRPKFLDAQQDMIEYYAHLAMIETDVDRVREEDRNLRDALRGCKFRSYGRLFSRLQIACLAISVGAHETEPEMLYYEDDEEDEQGDVNSALTSSSYWKGLREQLIIVKTYMLRKDANAAVPVVRYGYNEDDEDIPEENDELDGALEKHEMFQDSYQEVLLLMEVQEILSKFCERMSCIESDGEDVVKQLEFAVNSYESELQKLFLPQGIPEGADIGEETNSHIPEELTKFLLAELRKKPAEAAKLLLMDAAGIMCNDECVYSHSQLKQKMKSVLTKWCESILDIPRLVELGYGGVMAPIVAGGEDEDDVSSYGVEEDRLLTQKPVEDDDIVRAAGADEEEEEMETEPIPFRPSKRDGRRTSFAEDVRFSQGQVHSRHLPSKSPRMPKDNNRKSSPEKSPPRKSGRQASPPRTRNSDFNMTGDDDSNTQDPTATINQHGGATPPAATIRDSDEEGLAQARGKGTSSQSQSTPKKRKHTAHQSNIDDDDELWEDSPSATKRRTYMDWTQDETMAVKEGYEKFGKKWAMIKHNCQHRLSRRTNVQIKDKFRTMVKAGEIEENPEL